VDDWLLQRPAPLLSVHERSNVSWNMEQGTRVNSDAPEKFGNNANSQKHDGDWQSDSFETVFISHDAQLMKSAVPLSLFLNHLRSSCSQTHGAVVASLADG
jgi:hypothetical protein